LTVPVLPPLQGLLQGLFTSAINGTATGPEMQAVLAALTPQEVPTCSTPNSNASASPVPGSAVSSPSTAGALDLALALSKLKVAEDKNVVSEVNLTLTLTLAQPLTLKP
jgi:hypothetical protein